MRACFLVLYDEWLIKPASCNGDAGGGLQLFTTYYNLLQLFTSCYNFLQVGQVWICGYVVKVLFGFCRLDGWVNLNLSRFRGGLWDKFGQVWDRFGQVWICG